MRKKIALKYICFFMGIIVAIVVAFLGENGTIGSAFEKMANKNQENFVIDLNEIEVFGIEQRNGVWTKDLTDAAWIDINIQGHISRLTIAFSKPVERYSEVGLYYQKNEMASDSFLSSETIHLKRGDKFAELSLNEDVTYLRIVFTASTASRYHVDSIVINSSNRFLAEKFMRLPWLWIICISGVAAYLLCLVMNRELQKKPFLTTIFFVCLMSLILYRKFLCGDISYLYTTFDGHVQYLPTYENFARTFRENGQLPWWSFSAGFGFAQSYDVLLYPLNFIPFLSGVLGGGSALEMSFAWMQVIKIILAALWMYLFLKELELSPLSCSLISFLYAFCGIIILRGNWVFLADELYIAVFLFWAIERYLRRNQWFFIPLAVFLLALCLGFYYLYLYAVLIFICVSVRFVYAKQSFKKYIPFIIKCGGFCLIGIAMWSLILVGFSWSLFATERFADTRNYFALSDIFKTVDFNVLITALLRGFSTDTLGVYDQYSGVLNYLEGPLFYCGISCLFFVPLAFFAAHKRLKYLMTFGVVMTIAYMIFPFATDILNAFIRNEELGSRSYRLSTLWICIMFLVIAAYGLHYGLARKNFNEKVVLISGGSLLAVFIFTTVIAEKYGLIINPIISIKIVLLLFAWIAVFFFYNKKMRLAVAVIVSLAIIEAFSTSNTTIKRSYTVAVENHRQMNLSESGYYGSIPDALSYIRKQDDGLFRISGAHADNYARFSSPLYFGSFDTSYYQNIDSSTFRFLKNVYSNSFNGAGSKWSSGVGDNLYISTLTGYKYFILHKHASATSIPYGYVYWDTIGNVSIYRNSNALPFGFAYNAHIPEEDFIKLNDEEKKIVLMRCAVVKDDYKGNVPRVSDKDLKLLLEKASKSSDALIFTGSYSYMEWYEDLVASHEPLNISSWEEDHIKGEIELYGNGILYLPIANVNGWKMWVDGEEAEIIAVNLGFFGVHLSNGTHQIELRYRSDTITIGAALSLITILLYSTMIIFRKKLPWLHANINFAPANPEESKEMMVEYDNYQEVDVE